MDDLKDEIKLVANAEGVETGVSRAKRSLATLGQSVEQVGEQGAKGFQKMGAGSEDAGRRVDQVTKNMSASLQRQIAALEAGGTATRQYQESIARLRGADLGVLKPLLDQLDAAKAKAEGATRAQAELTGGMTRLGGVADLLRGQMIALAGSFTFAAGFAFVRQMADAIDALNDVKDATGASIGNISALEGVAQRTGTTLDVVTTSMVKLNDVLLKAKPGSDHALALKAIGLEAESLKKLDPAEALRQVAVALGGYADDANKARLIQDLFGKSLREMAPFLADLAEKTELVGKVTAEQAAEAEKFNKQLFELQTKASDAGRALVSGMLPGLNQITEAMGRGAKEGGLLLGIYRGLAEFGSIAMGTDKLGKQLTAAKDAQAEIGRLSNMMIGVQATLERDPGNEAAQRRMKSLRSQIEQVQKQALSATEAIKGLVEPTGGKGSVAGAEPPKPSVAPPRSASEIAAGAAAAKKALEEQKREMAEVAKTFAELNGLSANYYEELEKAQLQRSKGHLTEEQYIKRVEQLIQKQPFAVQLQKSVSDSESAYRKFLDSIQKSSDAIGQQADQQEAANATFGRSKTAIEQLKLAQMQLAAANEKAAGPWDPEHIAKMEQAISQQERYVASLQKADYTQAVRALDEQITLATEQQGLTQKELSLIGLTEVERRKIIAAREIELDLAKRLREIDKMELSGAEGEAQKAELRQKARQEAAIRTETAIAKETLAEWQRTTDQINQSLTEALLRGFESGKGFAENLRDVMRNMFNTLVLRPVISAVMNPVAGAVNGVVNNVVGSVLGGGNGGSGLLGNISSGSSFLSGLQGTEGILGKIGSFLGTNTVATNTALASQIGITSAEAAAGAAGAANAGGAGLGSLFSNPITMGIGAVAALAMLAKATKGETRTGGNFGVSFDGTVTNQRRDQTYSYVGQQFDRDFSGGKRDALVAGQAYRLEGDPVAQEQAIRDAVAGTASGINGLLKTLGSASVLTGFSAGLEESKKGRGGVFAGGIFNDGKTFGESGKGDNYDGTLYELTSTNSPDFKTALENFTLDLKQSTVQALQSVTDIPKSIQDMVKGVDAEALSQEAADSLLTAINTQVAGVETLRKAFAGMGMQQFAALAFDSAAAIAQLSGGFDALGNNLGTFYQNFYSESERTANATKQLSEALKAVGITLPKSRDEYRKLVEAQDLNTEAGQKAYATLLQLSGAFAGISESAASAANAVAAAERKRVAEMRAAAREIVQGQKDALAGLLKQTAAEAFATAGGLVGGIAVSAAEAEGVESFRSAIDGATDALTELEKLGLGDKMAQYAAEIAAVVQSTKQLMADQLSGSRLIAGDAQGAMAAQLGASQLRFTDFAGSGGFNAGAFNAAYAQERARLAAQLIGTASADALNVQDVGSVMQDLLGIFKSEELVRPVALGIRDSIVQISGDAGTAVRDAVDSFARQAAGGVIAQQYQTSAPGIASVYAARENVGLAGMGGWAGGGWQMGADVIAYGQALDGLNAALGAGKISAEEYERALTAVESIAGSAATLLGDTASQAERLASASYELGMAGFSSIGFYFDKLTDQAEALAQASAKAQEPLALTTEAIGRLTSVKTVFGDSASAVIDGLKGSGQQGAYMLSQELMDGSRTSRAQLIAESAAIAAGAMTTADAAAAARRLAESSAFSGLSLSGIRDAALLVDGVGAYDSKGFEDAFLRINAALSSNKITEDQYKALFNVALDMFNGVEQESESLASAMKNLRDSMRSFADQLLIDQQRTTLTPEATLAEMQRQYRVAFSSAATGDTDAISKFQGLANTMLDKSLYTNQAEYNAAFGRIYGDARTLERYGTNVLAAQKGADVVGQLQKLQAAVTKDVDRIMAGLAAIAKNTGETSKGIDQMNTVGA